MVIFKDIRGLINFSAIFSKSNFDIIKDKEWDKNNNNSYYYVEYMVGYNSFEY